MNSLVTKSEYDGYGRIAAEETSGRIVKFSKDGHWTVGVEEESLDGAVVLADMENLSIGWRKWKDAKIVDMDIGFVRDNFVPKQREELDDNDQSSWPRNSRGEPNDPWQFGFYLRMTDEDGNVYAWTAASSGARRAIGDLSRQFLRKRVNPHVELGAGSYRHREFGKINVPELKVVGWADSEPAKPAIGHRPFAPVDAIIDDSIPF
jgi:hypothetical protein